MPTVSAAYTGKVVAFPVEPIVKLLGLLAFPVSSSSTVKKKFWKGGVTAAVMSVDDRAAVLVPMGPKTEQCRPAPP